MNKDILIKLVKINHKQVQMALRRPLVQKPRSQKHFPKTQMTAPHDIYVPSFVDLLFVLERTADVQPLVLLGYYRHMSIDTYPENAREMLISYLRTESVAEVYHSMCDAWQEASR